MMPRLTASSTSKAPTTVPAADISHFRRPPDISSTILASSRAEMCKRFVAGQVLCTFQTKRCWAAASPGPRQMAAARISTGSAKAIQVMTSLLGFMGSVLSLVRTVCGRSLAEEPPREPQRDLGEDDAEGQPDQLQHHELPHPAVDVAE